ncbi:MAG: class I SAM-dependent methyltransferase [Chloroflexota bacterium]
MENTKQQVREFYDQVGWSQVGEGLYQNARYEDLRPVSREYIHKCHLRVNRHLAPRGDFLLDAGSGPVQWPEYLTYSEGYRFRVCADISITALKEARTRLGARGLYVVADIAALPFKPDAFDGVVSMHAIHHLPQSEHKQAFLELHRVLAPAKSAVVVNGWYRPLIARLTRPLRQLRRFLAGRPQKRKKDWEGDDDPSGTFVEKTTPDWLARELKGLFDYDILVWRSLGTRILLWFIQPRLGGRFLLKIVFWLEERFPRFFGRNGQYPLIVIRKQAV